MSLLVALCRSVSLSEPDASRCGDCLVVAGSAPLFPNELKIKTDVDLWIFHY
jgi:hypothetical protein